MKDDIEKLSYVEFVQFCADERNEITYAFVKACLNFLNESSQSKEVVNI